MSLADPGAITLVETKADPSLTRSLLPPVQHHEGSLQNGWADPDLPGAPEEVNSALSTCLQLTNSVIGSGILAFPYVLAKVGATWFGLLLVLFCGASYVGNFFLVATARKLGSVDLSTVVRKILGPRWQRSLELAVVMANMGMLCSYINAVGAMGHEVMGHWTENSTKTFFNSYAGVIIVFVPILVLPAVLRRSYGELWCVAYGSMFFVTFAIVVTGTVGGYTDQGPTKFQIGNAWPDNNWHVLSKLGTFAFAFSCQSAVLEAYASASKPAKEQWKSILGSAMLYSALLLLAIAIVGYGWFGQDVDGNVMLSLDSTDTLAGIALIGICLHLIFYIPNEFVIMRLFLFKMYDLNVLQVPKRQFVLVTVALLAFPVVTMAAVPVRNVVGVFNLILDITGDIPIGYSAYVVPAFLYLKEFDHVRDVYWWSAWGMLFIGLLLCAVCPVVDVVAFVCACRSENGCGEY